MLICGDSGIEAPASYLARQGAIADLATGIDGVPHDIDYEYEEHQTWADAQERLRPIWDRYAAPVLIEARDAIDLPTTRIPQLSLVSDRVYARTGFRYVAVPGTVPGVDFFGALARRRFASTQFIRWSGNPSYTPQPDILHEVGGHAVALANPHLAELHWLAGKAAVAAPSLLSAIASVFWYTAEFGVVASRQGWKAYGAGLLSSPGELGWFAAHAQVRPFVIAEMISTPYDISCYQPILFGAESLDQVLDVVGSFFVDVIESAHRNASRNDVDLSITSLTYR